MSVSSHCYQCRGFSHSQQVLWWTISNHLRYEACPFRTDEIIRITRAHIALKSQSTASTVVMTSFLLYVRCGTLFGISIRFSAVDCSLDGYVPFRGAGVIFGISEVCSVQFVHNVAQCLIVHGATHTSIMSHKMIQLVGVIFLHGFWKSKIFALSLSCLDDDIQNEICWVGILLVSVAQLLKVLDCSVGFTKVNSVSLTEQKELIKHFENVESRLVNG
mmetsp:Transcript_6555/g.24596  ORF Transcript_6555/g.24596 Transcript_6555/m.24596 type:complete len:218 (-) Transcript_6555:888-1541(-)